MRKAVQVDDDQFFKVQEKLAQLEVRTNTTTKDQALGVPKLTLDLHVSRIYNKKNFGGGGQEMQNTIC